MVRRGASFSPSGVATGSFLSVQTHSGTARKIAFLFDGLGLVAAVDESLGDLFTGNVQEQGSHF